MRKILVVFMMMMIMMVLGSATSAKPAKATLLSYEQTTRNRLLQVYSDTHMGAWVDVGLQSFNVDGEILEGFSLELDRPTSTTTHQYLKETADQTLTAFQATYVGDLYAKFIGDIDTDVEIQAFQLAIWEIIEEDISGGGTWNVGSGAGFRIPVITENVVVSTQANAWLAALGGSGVYVVDTFSNDVYQNYAVAVVPEPSTIILLGIGFLFIMHARKRIRAVALSM